MTPLLILGLGNDLMADDGAGLVAARRLRRSGPPASVRVEEGGSDVLVLSSLWRGEPRVWLIDAFWTGVPPGTIRELDHEEVLAIPQRHATAHQLSLPESLRWLALTDPELATARFRLFGIEAARVEPVEELSPEVEAAVGEVVRRIAGQWS